MVLAARNLGESLKGIGQRERRKYSQAWFVASVITRQSGQGCCLLLNFNLFIFMLTCLGTSIM
jgi:hypothetical protein